MPRNGTGGYSAPLNLWNPAVNGQSASPSDWQAVLDDLVAAIQGSVAADGQTPITGTHNYNNNRIIGLAPPIGAGGALRWQQLTKGANIASASTITIPNEGSLFDITGTTTITQINDAYPGRVVVLRFTSAVQMVAGAGLKTFSGNTETIPASDVLIAVNTEPGLWEIVYSKTGAKIDYGVAQWTGTPIGGYITPYSPPPKDNPNFRYILCTAGETGAGKYNNGVLTGEAVSGSAPNVNATATINLVGSPLNGTSVRLINTERRYLRPGSDGVTEESTNKAHVHTGTALSAGDHNHSFREPVQSASVTTGSSNGVITYTTGGTGYAGAHGHSLSITSQGESEVRVRALGATYYRRIL